MGLLAFLVVVLAIPLTVNIAQKQQELRQRAATNYTCPNGGSPVNDPVTNQIACYNDPVNRAGFNGYAVESAGGLTSGIKCPAGTSPFCQGSTLNSLQDGTFLCSNGSAPTCPVSTPPPTPQPNSPASITCTCDTSGGIAPNNGFSCTDGDKRFCSTNEKCTGTSTKPSFPCQVISSTPPSPPPAPACPNPRDDANPAHVNNQVTWGGKCTAVHDTRPVPIGGNNSCQFVSGCEIYTTGALCRFDNGTEYPTNCSKTTSPAAATCTAPYSTSCSVENAEERPEACTTNKGNPGFSIKQCKRVGTILCWYDAYTDSGNVAAGKQGQFCYEKTAQGGIPNCDGFVNQPTCQPLANSCEITNGTRTGTADKLQSTGSTSCTKVPRTEQCTLPSPTTCTSPNICNSSNQCVAQVVQPPPSGTPGSPVPVAPGNIALTFALKLDGLGTIGDRGTGSQKTNPARKSRSVTVQLIQGGATKSEKTGTLITSTLSTTVDMGALPTGDYTIKVKADGFLRRAVGSSFSLESGKNNELGTLSTPLPNGDVNRDGTVNASDFSAMNLSSCFGRVATGDCLKSDLDDDGQITLFDLNLLLREFDLSDE